MDISFSNLIDAIILKMKREGIIENKNIPFHILLTLVITAKNEVKDQFDGCTLCYKQCRDIMRNWLEHMGQ